ncbi:MAG: MFS transporter [Thermodesulfobacteriota bacterium]
MANASPSPSPAPAGDASLPASRLFLVLYLTVLSFATFYAPQPLLPLLRAEFGVSQAAASLLVTVTLLPLSFAPMAYGLLLGSVSTRRLLIVAVTLLAASELPLVFTDSFAVALGARAAQGLILPAAVTALMSYVAANSRGQGLQRAMALYIGATIFGAFLGRLSAGFLATMLGWRWAFGVLFAAILAGLPPLLRVKEESRAGFERLRPIQVVQALRAPGVLRLYLAVFFVFFVFAAVFNFLPFRLRELDPGISELRIALMYLGHLVGMMLALSSRRVVALCGGEIRAILAGLGFYLAVTPLLSAPVEAVIFTAVSLFCLGMFTVQTTAPGVINRLAPCGPGVVNGLYLSFYYAGGALGSYLPGYVYRHFGWNAFVLGLCALQVVALVLAAGLRRSGSALSGEGAGPACG